MSEVDQSCSTLCDLMDFSLSGSSVHGIFQARVLESVAISFITGIKMLGYKKVVHYENNRKFIGYTSPECVYLFGFSLVSSNIL